MTPEQEAARKKQLVSAAKALLSLQVGLAVGAIRIDKMLMHLSPELKKQHPIFGEFLSTIPMNVPLGSARLLWAPEALMEMDKKLSPIEKKYRTKLLLESIKIIANYG